MDGFLNSFTAVGFEMLPMAYTVVGGTTTHAREREQQLLDEFVVAATRCPGAYEDVVRMVVPEPQLRGGFPDRYGGSTLREHHGLLRPEAVAYG